MSLANVIITETGWRRLRWVFLVVAIVYSALQRGLSPLPDSEDIAQLIGVAFSILDGHGIVHNTPDWSDLSRGILQPLYIWPPGLPVTLASLTRLFGTMDRALVILEILSVVIFFGSWFVIVESMKESLSIKARILIWTTWAIGADPLFAAHASTGLAVTFTSAAIALAALALRSDRQARWLGVASGAAMGLAFQMHYATWPFLLVVPLACAILVRYFHNRNAGMVGGLHFATALTAMVQLAYWLKKSSGSVTFLPSYLANFRHHQIDWNSLLTIYPFFRPHGGWSAFGFSSRRTELRWCTGATRPKSFLIPSFGSPPSFWRRRMLGACATTFSQRQDRMNPGRLRVSLAFRES